MWKRKASSARPQKDVGEVKLTVEFADHAPSRVTIRGYWIDSGLYPLTVSAKDAALDLLKYWHQRGFVPGESGEWLPWHRVFAIRISEQTPLMQESEQRC